jgi:hypothetical protein
VTGSGDNDGTYLMWFDEAGNAIDGADWETVRAALAAFLETQTAAAGWAENRAEDLLCAMFTGKVPSP